MSKQNIAIGLAVVAIVIAAALAAWALISPATFGNKTASFWDAQSYKVSGTTVISSSRLATFLGLTVTTTNSATSTSALGCIQTVATSTATPIALVFSTVATSSTNVANGQTPNGFVLWKYGSCPF